MILRRLASALRRQDWVTVSVETMIVVLGVFLGLQVNNWNDARADRALEQEYLVRLYDDMNGSLQDYAESEAWDATRIESQELVLNALRNGELADEDRETFARGLIFGGSHNPIRRRWGTVEELKSTGNIAVLRDVELRAMIAATDGDYVRADRVFGASVQQILLLREPLLKRFDPVVYGFLLVDAVEAHFDFDALAADREFINLFAHVQLNSRRAVSFNEGHMQRIAALRDRLAQVLDLETGAPAP
jgi:hypothetical protein